MLKEIRELSCAKIPESILVRAHFNGFIKKIFLRDCEVSQCKDGGDMIYTIRIPGGRPRGDDFIRSNWESMEEMVNESFNAILLTLPRHALGKLVAHLFGLNVVMPLFVAEPVWEPNINSVIGDPDIVLCDESKTHFFLIELKIQEKKSNGKYSLQQHAKYSNYIQALEAEGKTARAMLLAPDDDYKKCLASREVRWFDHADGALLPAKDRIDGKPSFVTNKHVRDFQTFIDYQNGHIKTYGLDVKVDEFRPIKYRSFSAFKEALVSAAPHLEEAFSPLLRLS